MNDRYNRALLAALADPEVRDLGEARLVAQMIAAIPVALSFNESDHPRGQPDNAGQFAKGEAKPKNDGGKTSAKATKTDTPEFKRWFGDSKVVDADGDPQETHRFARAVFHGRRRSFDSFKPGASPGVVGYFSESRDYAGNYGDVSDYYLSIQNPLDLSESLESDKVFTKTGRTPKREVREWFAIMQKQGVDTSRIDFGEDVELTDRLGYWELLDAEAGVVSRTSNFVSELRRQGFDGIIGREDGARAYAAFEPTQIKSVDNKGTFDPKDERVAFSHEDQPRDEQGRYAPSVERRDSQHDIFNPQAQSILNRAMLQARELSAEARKALADAVSLDNPAEMAEAVLRFLQVYRVQIATLLTTTQVAALLEGAREVADKLPPIPPIGLQQPLPPSLEPKEAQTLLERLYAMPEMDRAMEIYKRPVGEQAYLNNMLRVGIVPPAPPNQPPVSAPTPGGDEDENFPIIDEAYRNLSSRNVMDRQTFDAIDAAARSKAFTVTGIDSETALSKIRDILAESAAEGDGYKTFRKKVLKGVEEATFLADNHLETIFRTNIQTAFSDGQQKVLNQPFVRSAFPYVAYEAFHDDRTRHQHLEMMKAGIQGTNVFRSTDPVFLLFRPPWSWNCRCSWIPLTIRQAAERGIKEAEQWLATGVEPVPPAYVAMPDFRPPPGFHRSLNAVPLSSEPIDASFAQVHSPVGGVTIGGEFYRGGQFIPKEALGKMAPEEKQALLDKEHIRADDDGTILAHFAAGDKKGNFAGHDKDFNSRMTAYIASHLSHGVSEIQEAIDEGDTDALDELRDDFEQRIYDVTGHLAKGMLQNFKTATQAEEGYVDTKPFEERIEALRDAIVEKLYEVVAEGEDGDTGELESLIDEFADEADTAYQEMIQDVFDAKVEEEDEKYEAERDRVQALTDQLDGEVRQAADREDELKEAAETAMEELDEEISEAIEAYDSKVEEQKEQYETEANDLVDSLSIEELNEQADAINEKWEQEGNPWRVSVDMDDETYSLDEDAEAVGESEDVDEAVRQNIRKNLLAKKTEALKGSPWRIEMDENGNTSVEREGEFDESVVQLETIKRYNADLAKQGSRFRIGMHENGYTTAVDEEDLEDEYKPDAAMAIGGRPVYRWTPEDEQKHPRNKGKFAKKGGGGAAAASKQPAAPKPAQQPQPQPAAAPQQPAPKKGLLAKVGELEHAAAAWVDQQVSRLPQMLQKPVRMVWTAMMASYTTAQAMVEEVAIERGATPEEVRRITGIATAADYIAGGKGMPMLAKMLGASGFGLIGSGFVPVGSLAYLGYSAVRDRTKTLRGARRAIKKLIAGKQQQAEMSLGFGRRTKRRKRPVALSVAAPTVPTPPPIDVDAIIRKALSESTKAHLDQMNALQAKIERLEASRQTVRETILQRDEQGRIVGSRQIEREA